MKRDNFISFPEVCGFSSMNHPASESRSSTSVDWKAHSGFIVFILNLKGEVTDVTCALQLQLHRSEYKPNESLESSGGYRERYPRPSWWTNISQQSFGLKQILRGKAQIHNLSDPRLRHSRLIPAFIGNRQALSVGQEYLGWNTGRSKEHQDFFGRLLVTVLRVKRTGTSLEAIRFFLA